MYNQNKQQSLDWREIKNNITQSGKIGYALYLSEKQPSRETEDDNIYFQGTASYYDADSDFNSGSDSAASVYSLLGVSPRISSVTDEMVTIDGQISQVMDFDSRLHSTLP